LVTGLCTLALFITHGAVYLALKTTLEVRGRARSTAMSVGVVAAILMALSVGWQNVLRGTTLALILGVVAVVSLSAGILLTRRERDGWAFTATALSIGLFTLGWFASIYPDVLPSTIDPAYSLNITNAASTPYTLTLMSWIALVFSPIILGYQAWSYWVFRKRISARQMPESPTQVPVH
jgi:cytochrome d ubiquinol oxidase subunit II